MKKITLTPDEQIIVETIALNREAYDQGNRIKDRLATSRNRNENIINATGAEFAAAKALNVYPPLTWTEIGGVDLLGPKKHRCDVKWIPPGSRAMSVRDNGREADYYIGVRGEFPTYEILGSLSAAQVKTYPILNGRNNTRYRSIPVEALLA